MPQFAYTMERAPHLDRIPHYAVTSESAGRRVRVVANGVVIAESDRALVVRETAHDPVFYVPHDDVRMDLLQRTDHRTRCPFKGNASHFTLELAGARLDNAVWSYEHPCDEVAWLEGHLAFYPDLVTITEV